MNEELDFSTTIIPKSDQLNADDLIAGNMVITVTKVIKSNDPKQPMIVHYIGDNGRPYKPCLTMRRILIAEWGKSGKWEGRSMMLYRDPEVHFGPEKVGGIKICGMTHIPHDKVHMITVKRGKRVPQNINALSGIDELRKTWEQTPPNIKQALGGKEYIEKLKEKAGHA